MPVTSGRVLLAAVLLVGAGMFAFAGFRSTTPPGYKGPPYVGHSCRAAVFSFASNDSDCSTSAGNRLAASGVLVLLALAAGAPPVVRLVRPRDEHLFDFDRLLGSDGLPPR